MNRPRDSGVESKTETWRLTELEIVGYADCLFPEVLPDIVEPIYRVRQRPDLLIVPPYEYLEDRVRTHRVLGEDELERLVRDVQATELDPPIPARPGHLLWIDLGIRPRYMPKEQALAELRKLSELKLEEARDAFRGGQTEEAIRLAQVAFCAAAGASEEAAELMVQAWKALGDEERAGTAESILQDIRGEGKETA